MFTHKEVVELMIKKQGIHEGIWGISLRFGMKATNFGSSPDANDLFPTVMIPVMEIGLHRFDRVTNLSVDAAIVNPAPPQEGGRMKPKHRH